MGLLIIWENKLLNIAAHLGAERPCRGWVIKMLCAQLKTPLNLRGRCRARRWCTKRSNYKCRQIFEPHSCFFTYWCLPGTKLKWWADYCILISCKSNQRSKRETSESRRPDKGRDCVPGKCKLCVILLTRGWSWLIQLLWDSSKLDLRHLFTDLCNNIAFDAVCLTKFSRVNLAGVVFFFLFSWELSSLSQLLTHLTYILVFQNG